MNRMPKSNACSETVQPAILPAAGLLALPAAWEAAVRFGNIPPYVLPGPSAIVQALINDAPVLFGSLLVTLTTTVEGFAAAVIGGIGLALLFDSTKWVEDAFLPYAVILQVTPVIAIAP